MTFVQAPSAVYLKPSFAEEVVNANFTLVIRFPSVNPKTSSRRANNGILAHVSCGNHFPPHRSMLTLGKS